MKHRLKSLLANVEPFELVRICNEKMICAARDLAEFTPHGLNANFIVSLAHSCEKFEKLLKKPQPHSLEFNRLREEILEKVYKICETGMNIWSEAPNKYRNYVLEHYSGPSSTSASFAA